MGLRSGVGIEYMKGKPSLYIEKDSAIEQKNIEDWLRLEKVSPNNKTIVSAEAIKVDGRDAFLMYYLYTEDNPYIDLEHTKNATWSAKAICKKIVYSIGYQEHLDKAQREKFRKERSPPKILQQVIDGFSCK